MDPSYASAALLWGERLFWAGMIILSNWFTVRTLLKRTGSDQATLKSVVEHDAVIIREQHDLIKAQSVWADQMQEHQVKSMQNAGWIAKSIIDATYDGARGRHGGNGAPEDPLGARSTLDPPPEPQKAQDPEEKSVSSSQVP